MTNITSQCCAIANMLKCRFTLKGEPIATEKVMSETGLLPSFMRRADQLASFCLGYGIGVSFEDVQDAMQRVRVKFDDATPNSLRLLCFTDVLIEIVQQAPSRESTPVDDLMYD